MSGPSSPPTLRRSSPRRHRQVIEALQEKGVTGRTCAADPRGCQRRHLRGKTFVVTGTLDSMSARGGAGGADRARRQGVIERVEEDELPRAGAEPGSKLAKAEELGVPVLDEAALWRCWQVNESARGGGRRVRRRAASAEPVNPWGRLAGAVAGAAARGCSWACRGRRRHRGGRGRRRSVRSILAVLHQIIRVGSELLRLHHLLQTLLAPGRRAAGSAGGCRRAGSRASRTGSAPACGCTRRSCRRSDRIGERLHHAIGR